jgi:flagellar biogenesis protein FliO
LADAPIARKRAVPAARPKAPRAAPKRPTVLEDEAPTTNYALRLTEGLDEEPTVAEAPDTFALRLSQALDAINSHHTPPPTPEPAPSPETPRVNGWLASLEKLPPIRLPIGPAIPWRIGLPLLVALVVGMGLMSRAASQADPQGVKLPAQQTYPVQQEAPLFATPVAAQPTPQPTPQTIGVSDTAANSGFDLGDVAIKLIAVLGLAYASLMLLKRFGVGGMGGSSRGSGDDPDLRVLTSIALAPNRSVHVIQVPGGKTLLVGATPTSVNLLTELDDPRFVSPARPD